MQPMSASEQVTQTDILFSICLAVWLQDPLSIEIFIKLLK